tara:strand:+ start:407 stop:1057 length:651 start_codon:yes stop_codon:yes gene_type:complete
MSPLLHLGLILIYMALIFFFRKSGILYPFKLLVVYVHEMCHGIATVLTDGKTVSIEVSGDESGLHYGKGGNRILILCAGYLGTSLFGALLIISSQQPEMIKITCWLLIALFLVFLPKSKSLLAALLNIGFCLVLLGAWWFKEGIILPYLIAFFGTMSSMYSIYDIYSDTIQRELTGSDSSKTEKITGINSRVVGTLWLIISIGMMVGAVFFGILTN